MSANERRPAGNRAAENLGGDRGRAQSTATADVPSLAAMNAHATKVALAYYEAGLEHGIELGRAQAEAEMDERWRPAYEIVQAAARREPYAELCERRGEPERAERQRRLLRERGIQ